MEKAVTTTVQQTVGGSSVRGSAMPNPGLRPNKVKFNPNAAAPVPDPVRGGSLTKVSSHFKSGFEKVAIFSNIYYSLENHIERHEPEKLKAYREALENNDYEKYKTFNPSYQRMLKNYRQPIKRGVVNKFIKNHGGSVGRFLAGPDDRSAAADAYREAMPRLGIVGPAYRNQK